MKLLTVFAIFTISLTYVSTNVLPPTYDGPTYELTIIDDPTNLAMYDDDTSNLAPVRQRRVTCDILSFTSKWLTINHSACAAKCLAQHRKGGRCHDGICVCRR